MICKTKRILFSLLCCVLLLHSVAQDRWLRTQGGNNQDEALCMSADANGGYFIGGYFSSTADLGGVSVSSQGLIDGFVQHVDIDGVVDWVVPMGGSGPDRVVSMETHPDGGVVVLGYFSQTLHIGPYTLASGSDSLRVFVAKLSASGAVEWAMHGGSEFDDVPYDIAIDNAGNSFITGQFRGELHFGPFFDTSEPYQDSPLPSYDIFLCKLNTLGQVLWLRTGKSDQDNRGTCLDVTAAGGVILGAQISDTITFVNTHDNEVLNAGALVSFDALGNELWLRRFTANQVLPRDLILTDDEQIKVTGDFSGTMTMHDGDLESIPVGHIYNVFLSYWTMAGDHTLTSTLGSGNRLTGMAMVAGDAGETYVTGTFRCSLSELNDANGPALFKSMGYDDVWIGRFESSGDKTWFKHYGGPGRDFCSAIAYRDVDRPVLAGSYSAYFHVPADDSFMDVSTPYSEIGHYPPQAFTGFCGVNGYGELKTVEAAGLTESVLDIFLTDGLLLDKGPLDYYTRYYSVDCSYDAWEPCISFNGQPVNGPNDCVDSIVTCAGGELDLLMFQSGPFGIFSPRYSVLWNNGSTEMEIPANSSGVYEVEVSRDDGCESYQKEIYLNITGYPSPALITDDAGVNIQASNPENIQLCGDSVSLLAESLCEGCSGTWNNGVPIDSTFLVTSSGLFSFLVTDSFGCTTINDLNVSLVESPVLVLDSVATDLLYESESVAMDSLSICEGDFLTVIIEEDIYSPLQYHSVSMELDVYIDGEFSESFTSSWWESDYYPYTSGVYSFVTHPSVSAGNICGEEEHQWSSDSVWVYVEVLDAPEVNLTYSLSPSPLCPGDTALLLLDGADTYLTTGPFSQLISTEDSVLLFTAMELQVSGTVTSPDGCVFTEVINLELAHKEAPPVSTFPDPPVVCPGDSVQLTVVQGVSYQWVGPLGQIIDDVQSIMVTTPGVYYCIHEDDEGCVLESEIVETFEYSSPFLSVFPDTELCFSGSAEVQVFSSQGAEIQWASPVNSNSHTVTLTEAGVYSVSSTQCGITTQLEVTLTEAVIEAEITALDSVLCPGESTELFAPEGPYFYEWSPSGESSQSITIDTAGTYSITVVNSVGCSETDDILIGGAEMPMPSSTDVEVCSGQDAVLEASSPFPVFWSVHPQGPPVSSYGQVFIVDSVYSPIDMYVFAGDSTCYSDPQLVMVTLDPGSVLPSMIIPEDPCLGQDVNITVDPIYPEVTYEWVLPSGEIFIGAQLYIDSVSELDDGEYLLTLSSSSCVSEIGQGELEVLPPYQVEIMSSSDALCEGESWSLEVADPIWTSIEWQDPLGDSYDGNVLVLDSVQVTQSGFYTMSAADADGCTGVATSLLQVYPYPMIDIDSSLICESGLLYADVTGLADAFVWSDGSLGSMVQIDDDGPWWVIGTNGNLCSAADSIYIEDPSCIEEMTNVFTPNGDGQNDHLDFNVLGLDIEEVQIFNRWGSMVRRLTSGFKWDGTNDHGQQLNDGTYFWVVISEDYSLRGLPKKGYITLYH